MLAPSNFNQPALYNVDVSSKLGPEYVNLFDDVARMVLIQLTIQLMFYLTAPDRGFITDEFVLLVLYIVLGVSMYWLVFKNLFKFK
jgi:hypothetical protein